MTLATFWQPRQTGMVVPKGKIFGSSTPDDSECLDLSWIIDWIRTARPRLMSPPRSERPEILFTFGACAFVSLKHVTTCGAVLFSPCDGSIEFFGMEFSTCLRDEWASDGQNQLVTESEVLPVLIASQVWATELTSVQLLTLVDPEPATYSLTKGSSNIGACNNIVRSALLEDQKLGMWNWHVMLPSYSDPADDPSRQHFAGFLEDFLKAVPVLPAQPNTLRKGR